MEHTPISLRKKSRTKSKIQLEERIEIVHEVLCQFKPLKMVAKKQRKTVRKKRRTVRRRRRTVRSRVPL